MKGLLKVFSVELAEGFLPPYHREYSASGFSVTKAKCLKVRGYVDGLGDVCFFSPSVLIKTNYYSNTEFTHVDDNKWIGYNEEIKSSNSTNDLPSYVQFGKKIFPLIKEGDEINVSFSVKGVFGKTTVINRVKIID